jgi:uncharacterized protein YaaR (DUF327 family)
MKCTRCNERMGNTRCEGCSTLFCLPCMIAHHDGLQQQFHTLMDRRNEVKQAMDRIVDTDQQLRETSYLDDINRWEQKMIEHIQRVASTVRTNANELFRGHMVEIGRVFEQLSTDMEQQQKENILWRRISSEWNIN